MTRAGNRIVADKQMQVFNKLLGQGVAFFSQRESSELLMKVTQSAQRARTVIDTIVNTVNNDQAGPILEYMIQNSDKIGAISYQPVSFTGRDENISDAGKCARNSAAL